MTESSSLGISFLSVFAVIMSAFGHGASLAYALKELRKEKNK